MMFRMAASGAGLLSYMERHPPDLLVITHDLAQRVGAPLVARGSTMAKTSFTSVGSSADSLEPLLRWALATGHAAEILDE
jgi:3',5'-cyclic AMP phosphodiesterase CpdA